MKQLMKRKTQIHNFCFLISPTTHLFPLSGQLGSSGVSIKITLKSQIWNMEMIINQIILHCRLVLCYIKKRWTKIKKWHGLKSPQGGWGMGSKDPIKKLFLLPAVTISTNWYDASWFLYRMKSRAYKVRKLKISVKKGDPWGIQKARKSLSNRRSSSFLLYLIKTSNLIRLKYSQNHSESTFGSTYF